MARTLHLVDLENLAGGTDPTTDLLAWWPDYISVVDWHLDDLVVLGCSAFVLRHIAFDAPAGSRLVSGGLGRDAGERALLAEYPSTWVAQRFDRVVIGSGDHLFRDLAQELRYLDTEVGAVSRRGSLARALQVEVDWVAWLDHGFGTAA